MELVDLRLNTQNHRIIIFSLVLWHVETPKSGNKLLKVLEDLNLNTENNGFISSFVFVLNMNYSDYCDFKYCIFNLKCVL